MTILAEDDGVAIPLSEDDVQTLWEIARELVRDATLRRRLAGQGLSLGFADELLRQAHPLPSPSPTAAVALAPQAGVRRLEPCRPERGAAAAGP